MAEITTVCRTCRRALALTVTSDPRCSAADAPGMLVFEPEVDWVQFKKPNIIHDY